MPNTPTSQGERIRYARTNAGLSQNQVAAALRLATGSKITKSLVSQWERNAIKNPSNAHLLALEALTGISATWIVKGRGPKEVALRSSAELQAQQLDKERLARAIAATQVAVPDRFTPTIADLYDLIRETPSISDEMLRRIAASLLGPGA